MEPEESVLAERIAAIEPQVELWPRQASTPRRSRHWQSSDRRWTTSTKKILVMHDDATIRERRISLLKRLFDTFLQIADISEVVVSN